MRTLGGNGYAFEVVEDWAKLPDGWTFHEVSGVAVDGKDRVYVFNRGKHPLIVFDRDGNFAAAWGEGVFTRPHAAKFPSRSKTISGCLPRLKT